MIGPDPVTDPQAEAAPALTLTATERLARQLREAHNLALADSGQQVWEAPQVRSLRRYIIDCWTSTWPDAQLLSAAQEWVLWREAVERDSSVNLLAPQSAAREARRADQLLRRHRIDLDSLPQWQDEHQAFRRWRAQVEARLAQNRWLTAADLAAQVCGLIEAGRIVPPMRLCLAGFVEPPVAAEQAVLDALAARGTQIEILQPNITDVRVQRWQVEDEDAQWRCVAQDIRERLRAHADHRTPPPRIVIALPDPAARREALDAVLRDALAPGAARGQGLLPWRWERGRRLSDQPLVNSLLAILQVQRERNAPALISRLLLSSALWSEAERAHTARVDYLLRRQGRPQVSLTRVVELLPRALAAKFMALRDAVELAPRRELPSQWSSQFRQRLTALGWPGSEALDSQAYQVVRAARGLLDRLGTLDAQLGAVPASSARDWLGEMLRSTEFEARAEHDQPVLIISYEDAASLNCELLYLLDANASRLPLPARPTPFLPGDALRAAGIAEADPAAWLARTQLEVQRLLSACAPEVIVCAPQHDARGAELSPSSLLGEVADWEMRAAPSHIGALEASLATDATERPLLWPATDRVPPVDAAEQALLRTDSGLFKAWFESPFFAFCRYRLGIEALPEPAVGVDARVQGNLVHAVLEALWNALGDSRALAALDESALRQRIAAAVQEALPQHLPVSDYGAVLLRLEQARAEHLILQWMLHERRRQDPFVVQGTELRAQPVVAGLQLRLRLDRVDQVETSFGPRWLVIDYKTGREARPQGWRAEKLIEPQLPLYASYAATLAADIPQVDGICFAHLKDGHPALAAQTNWREVLIEPAAADTDADWQTSLMQWRQALDQAAQGFLAGDAGVADKLSARSPYADLLLLCPRVSEAEP